MLKADLRNTDTKERILAEARKLYQVGGYNQLNLDQIARTLKITRPALYFHFPGGKEQVLLEVLRAWSRDVIEQVDRAIQESPNVRERLKNILKGVKSQPLPDEHEVMRANLHQFSANAQAELQKVALDINEKITGVIEEGIRQGELKPVDPNIAFFSFVGLCKQVENYQALAQIMPPNFAHRLPFNSDEIVDQLFELWFTGITLPGNP